ncbi:MAG: mechanosensitive ion channel [Deltaproteobacteria bacterium]|nr:mechanosensitive ion channel [Deltaproteobacteria bacterium]
MAFWDAVQREATESLTLYLLGALVVALAVLLSMAPELKRRRATLVAIVALHVFIVPLAAWSRETSSASYTTLHLVLGITAAVAGVIMGGTIVFAAILPALRIAVPRIIQDVMIGSGAAVAVMVTAGRSGFDVTGVLATSAVITVVVGFALQETLGNIFAGLALQIDDSFRIGDWIKVQDLSGRVTEIRWRYTAIETRNWETLVVPNSVLTRERFLILGRRAGKPRYWRRWVYFNVDYRFQPSDVIHAVEEALRSAPIENIAADPQPNCVLMDLAESYGHYAVRYWLTDFLVDDPTDSIVRTRIFFALKRVGIPFSLPAHAVFMTKESATRKAQKTREDEGRRLEIITRIDMFKTLPVEDRELLAHSLRYAPFTRGETMTRQGAPAHWLYIILEGEASVRMSHEGESPREIAELRAGDVFGERSLLTGEPRSATVIAKTDVECYRLDKAALSVIIERQPRVAEELAAVLAKREQVIEASLDRPGAKRRDPSHSTLDLVGRIRDFFGLGDEDAS